jgi:hypothetical protein
MLWEPTNAGQLCQNCGVFQGVHLCAIYVVCVSYTKVGFLNRAKSMGIEGETGEIMVRAFPAMNAAFFLRNNTRDARHPD